jgi:signal transduction histidine kinase/DNA-binding LacI/PurR family transcriptional regulator
VGEMHLDQTASRLTIAFFTHGIDFNIGFARYAGVSQKANELDCNLICVMHESRTEKASMAKFEYNNLFYQLLSQRLNGLICGIAPSNYAMSEADLTQLMNHYQIPTVSLTPLDRVPQIRFDDYQGMRQVLLHLIKDHGLQKIFYVRGPFNHNVARERYRAYQDLMKQYGYFDPKLVSPPLNWNPKQEQFTVDQLFKNLQPGRDVEAIVAANDMWALECIEKLQEKGVRIPEDLAVVGINDSFQGKNCNVSLTTVAYPFFEQGRRALEQLFELLNGKPIADLWLDTQLVKRHSCGCIEPEIVKICNAYRINSSLAFGRRRSLDHQDLQKQIVQCFQPDLPLWLSEQIMALLREFVRNLQSETAENFLKLLNSAIKNDLAAGNERWTAWQNFLTLLQQNILPDLDPILRNSANELYQQAREVLNDLRWRNLEYQIVKKQDQTRLMNQLQAEMSRIFNRSEMVALLTEYLPKIGFSSCYLVLYEEPQPYVFPQNFPEFSRLIMGFNQTGPIDVGGDGLPFSTRQFLPLDLLPVDQRFTLFASPLFFGENQFGYLIAELTSAAYPFYKVLCNQIEYCLWGTDLFQRQKKVEKSLARSNKELAQFAYIASHDLQEPLRKIIAFGDRMRQAYAKGAIEQGQNYLERVQSAAARMQVLIDDLLTYSRVTTKAQSFSKVELSQILSEVLSDLEVKISGTKAQIMVSTLPAISGDPLQMRQLFQNLLGNALKFCRPGITPVIKVYSRTDQDQVIQIVVEDNGIGIKSGDYERIFGVFERLHGRDEYEGSGVGLAICKKIVERHSGNIKVESQLGVGTKFQVELPKG